jgi:DNA repair exonuclease SbcCD ATPase subunit
MDQDQERQVNYSFDSVNDILHDIAELKASLENEKHLNLSLKSKLLSVQKESAEIQKNSLEVRKIVAEKMPEIESEKNQLKAAWSEIERARRDLEEREERLSRFGASMKGYQTYFADIQRQITTQGKDVLRQVRAMIIFNPLKSYLDLQGMKSKELTQKLRSLPESHPDRREIEGFLGQLDQEREMLQKAVESSAYESYQIASQLEQTILEAEQTLFPPAPSLSRSASGSESPRADSSLDFRR